MADNNTLNFDLDAPAVPTLTLDPAPAAAPVEEKKEAPAPAAPEVRLTPEEQAMVAVAAVVDVGPVVLQRAEVIGVAERVA